MFANCRYSGLSKICGIRFGQRRGSITLATLICTGQDALCRHLKVPGGESASLALLADKSLKKSPARGGAKASWGEI